MESTNVSTEAPLASAQPSAADAAAAAPQLSASDLIAKGEAHIADLVQRIADARTAIDTLADSAARGTVTADALSQIAQHDQDVKDLSAEKDAVETTLVPLRAAVAKVDAEQRAAADVAKRVAAAGNLFTLVDSCAVATNDLFNALDAVVSAAGRRRALVAQLTEEASGVVRDQRQLTMVVRLADQAFGDDGLLALDRVPDALSAALAVFIDRVVQLRDRIAEATT